MKDSYILHRIKLGTLWVDVDTGEIFTPKGKLKGYIDSNGYVRHQFWLKNRRKLHIGAHRIVLLYALGRPLIGIPDHINRNRQDNRIENLREVDASINSRNRNAKISHEDVATIKQRRSDGETYESIANSYDVKVPYIWRIVKGTRRREI